ncbi:hypothetical protein C7S17_2127 [Burkholderia thailandensis]|nr:hypothetical protein [Burkholderia thailandensis]
MFMSYCAVFYRLGNFTLGGYGNFLSELVARRRHGQRGLIFCG